MFEPIDVHEFMKVTLPALQKGDPADVARTVTLRWRPREICKLLDHKDPNVRRVAAVTLGLVGDRKIISCLTLALKDPDEQVNQMAEHSLWAIWFRACDSRAGQPFREGVGFLSREAYELAIGCFEKAILIDPDFAEAYNQCATAHLSLYEWPRAIEDAGKAVRLMPMHFGAIAGMGHAYTQMGQLDKAVSCYRRALDINPRMSAVSRMLNRLEQRHKKSLYGSSGEIRADSIASS